MTLKAASNKGDGLKYAALVFILELTMQDLKVKYPNFAALRQCSTVDLPKPTYAEDLIVANEDIVFSNNIAVELLRGLGRYD